MSSLDRRALGAAKRTPLLLTLACRAAGCWEVRSSDGMVGGCFADRKAAMKFACAEAVARHGAVLAAPDRAPPVLPPAPDRAPGRAQDRAQSSPLLANWR